jgi:hypothetical protein
MTDSEIKRRSFGWWPLAAATLLVGYVLSSGPVLAGGCWLRERTHWDGWYGVFWLYYPLLDLIHNNQLFSQYAVWWFELFGTVGPG